MRRFAKWHIWLGWLVGVPVLMWTVTGLIMVIKPIEEVRGSHLRAETPAVSGAELAMPVLASDVTAVELVRQPDGPVWVVQEASGGRYRYSARDGTLLPPVLEEEARALALATFAGDAELEKLTYFPSDEAPMDLRVPRNSWQAHFADGTNVYVDDTTGEVLALRTGWWRVFDFAWGLHIMDLKTREDTSHPVLILFAALAIIGSLLGCVLMFRRRKAKVRR